MIVVAIINFILGMITVLPIREYLESKSEFVFTITDPGIMYAYYFVYKLTKYIVFTLIINIIIIYVLKKILKKKNKKLNLVMYWVLSIIIFTIPIMKYIGSSAYLNELIMRKTIRF